MDARADAEATQSQTQTDAGTTACQRSRRQSAEDVIQMSDGNDTAFEADEKGTSNNHEDVVNSFIVLYGITLTMLGVVIPVCDGLASGTLKHQTYDQVFYLYMHTVGLAFLGFISCVIYKFKEPPRRSGQHLELDDIGGDAADYAAATAAPGLNGSAQAPGEDASDKSKGGGSGAGGGGGGGGGGGRSFEGIGGAVISGLVERIRRLRMLLARWRARTQTRCRSPPGQTPGVWMSAEGINLYMRLGVIIFGFGVMIHDAFKLADTLEHPNVAGHCRSYLWQVQLLVHLLFILLQTFHLFKSHRIVVAVYPSAVKFAFAHLIVTNLCIWMKAVIYEVKMALTKNLLDGPPGGAGVNGSDGSR